MQLAYVIGCYPFINLTFVEREICALEARGVAPRLAAMLRPRPGDVLDDARWRMPSIFYVRPVDWGKLARAVVRFGLGRPRLCWGTLAWLLSRPHPSLAARPKTIIHFFQGVYLAEHLRAAGATHIHAHFADRATVAALVASRLLGIPFSFTAHAKDIYAEAVFLKDKIEQAAFVVTCTRANLAHLRGLAAPDKIHVVYHGLPLAEMGRAARAPQTPPIILAVGKLVEKKGFRYLLEACALLRDRGCEFSCLILGEGPERQALEAQRAALGLDSRVHLPGNRPLAEVLSTMRRATVFTLPSVIARNQDRDGIPNVILEAMAAGLPVVSTDISAIPEVVRPGETGLLVPQRDAEALAGALARLLADGGLRARLAERARAFVAEHFDDARNAARLLELFERAARAPAPHHAEQRAPAGSLADR